MLIVIDWCIVEPSIQLVDVGEADGVMVLILIATTAFLMNVATVVVLCNYVVVIIVHPLVCMLAAISVSEAFSLSISTAALRRQILRLVVIVAPVVSSSF